MAYRGHDNFSNPATYIQNQLFPYDYDAHDDFEILKMKIWVLDGDFTDSDGGPGADNDYDNPGNHYRWLLNELTFLDRCVRTLDGLLENGEMDFGELKEKRIKALERWVTKIDKNTGLLLQGWQMPYHKRPTYLTNSQFLTLYTAFKVKQANGELSTAFEIVSKLTDYCIDIERVEVERGIDSYEDPEVIEAKLLVAAGSRQEQNDRLYVEEMARIRDEMLEIINDLYDITSIEYIAGLEPGVEFEPALLVFPQERIQVSMEKEPEYHKGMISTGHGYRFTVHHLDGTEWPDAEAFGGNIEQAQLGGEEKTTVGFLVVSVIDSDIDETICSYDDIETELEETALDRFKELNSRWVMLNDLREYQIQQIGTRSIIESMVLAEIPYLLEDMEAHFGTKSLQKDYMTDILVELCAEFFA